MLVCHTLQHPARLPRRGSPGARARADAARAPGSASSRVQTLQSSPAGGAPSIPEAAPKACNTEEHRRFAASLTDAIAQSESGADPTEQRA